MVMWSRRCFPNAFFLFSSPSSFLYSCFPASMPSPTDSTMFLYTSFYTCISAPSNMSLMHNKECACMSVHACPWTEAASATLLPVEKSRDVIDCYSYSNSESAQRVGTPPPLALWQHQSRAAAYSDSRGCWHHHEEREPGCEDRNMRRRRQISARWTAALSDGVRFHTEADDLFT